MRQFQIQAVCDEKVLWELMALLERKCTSLLARPITNGAAPEAASKPRQNDKLSIPLRILNTMHAHGGPMRVKEIAAVLAEQGITRKKIDGPMHMLGAKNFIRRTAPGRYTLTKQGATYAANG
jgi:Holliday junction resolvasome RuvABC ATP-dependent DNA helicase subunit